MTKFGHQLLETQYPPWASQYFRYKLLKKLIKLITAASGDTPGVDVATVKQKLSKLHGPELARVGKSLEGSKHASLLFLENLFVELLGIEQARISAFARAKWSEIGAADAFAAAAPTPAGSCGLPGVPAASASTTQAGEQDEELRQRMSKMSVRNRKQLLTGFQDINYIAFFKIAKKYDKATGEGLLPLVMGRLDAGKFCRLEDAASLPTLISDAAGATTPAANRRAQGGSPADTPPTQALISRATKLSKQAVMGSARNLLIDDDEQEEALEKTERHQTEALERLDTMDEQHHAAGLNATELLQQVTRIKADVFGGFIKEVISGISQTDPETAAALEKLQSAHATLFGKGGGGERAEGDGGGGGGTPAARAAQGGEAGAIAEADRESTLTLGEEVLTAGLSRSFSAASGASEAGGRAWPSCRRFEPAVLRWIHDYEWREQLRADVVAGFTLAIMGLPQGLAYASLVGVDPIYGVFTVIFPAMFYAVLGQSKQGAVGPMSIPCLIIAATVDKHTDDGDPIAPGRLEVTMALTFAIGCVVFVAGFLKLGMVIDFISTPNLNGFIQASALMVMVSMTPKLIGVSVAKSPVIYKMVPRTIEALPDTQTNPLVFSIAGIVGLLILNTWKARAAAIAKTAAGGGEGAAGKEGAAGAELREHRCALRTSRVFAFLSPTLLFVVGTALSGLFMCDFKHPDDDDEGDGEGGAHRRLLGALLGASSAAGNATAGGVSHSTYCAGVAMVGPLPTGFPMPTWPSALSMELLVDAASISMVILAEHVSNVKLYSAMHGYSVDHSSELMAIGATNCLGALFSCFAVGARFTGSALNNSVGATSQISLFISGVVSLALLPLITPLLYYLPKPALSIVVIFAVAKVVDIKSWAHLWRVSKHDFSVMLIAFVATLSLGVLSGLGVAILTSLLVFIVQTTQPRVVELGRATRSVHYRPLLSTDDLTWGEKAGFGSGDEMAVREAQGVEVRRVEHATILRFESPLAFFNVSALCDRLTSEVTSVSRESRRRLAHETRRRKITVHLPELSRRAILLDFSCIPWVDSTAGDVFLSTIRSLHDAHGLPIVLCNVNRHCLGVLRCLDPSEAVIPTHHIYFSIHDAARAIAVGSLGRASPAAAAAVESVAPGALPQLEEEQGDGAKLDP